MALTLCATFLFNLPLSSYAANYNSDIISEAINNLKAHNFLYGEIIESTISQGHVLITLDTNGNAGNILLDYSKETNGDISIVIYEGNVSDNVIIREDGTILLDGNIVTCFSNNQVMPLNTYASAFYDYMPSYAGGTYSYFGRLTGDIAFEQMIINLSAYAIALRIERKLGIPAILVEHVAGQLKSTAMQYDDTGTAINYVRTVYKNNKDYPLSIYYRHDINYYLQCGQYKYVTFYEEETLI